MKRAALLTFALALAAFLGTRPVLATTISAPFLTVGVGDTFTVDVSVADALDLASFEFELGFTPSIVQADEAGAGAGAALDAEWFFTSPGAVDNTGGHILGVSASSGFSSLTGSGAVASFQFTALASGISPLDLSSVFLNLSDEGFVIVDGQITVIAAQAPEPATLGLLAGALLVLASRRLLERKRL